MLAVHNSKICTAPVYHYRMMVKIRLELLLVKMCTHQVSDESLAVQTRGLGKLEYVCSLLNAQPLQLRVDGHEGSCPTHSITEWKKRQKLLILLITITSIGLEIIKSFVSVTSLLSCQ